MNWLLVVVLIILLGSALHGYQKGLIRTVFALVSIVAAMIVSSLISPEVSKALQKNEAIENAVQERIEKVVSFDKEKKKIKKSSEETDYIEHMELPSCIKKTLLENNHKDMYKALSVTTFEEYIVGSLSVVVINTISYIICFISMLLILGILRSLLDLVSKLPVIKQVNKSAGLIVGLISGCIKIWIFFLVITIFSTSTFGANIFEMINESPLLSFIYDNNLLMKLITDITGSVY